VRKTLENQWGAASDRIISGSLLGRPGDAIEQIAPFVDAGAQMINIAIRPPWDMELLAQYVQEIIPQMRVEFSGIGS
jgi:alkanesulfonate monooxygenase SsuD/methylene tetrahydromethanopterin reductase-like flavin-dependent oxidoreductase (luciferase family)